MTILTILATPEKLDALSRRHKNQGGVGFFTNISVVLNDEVHYIGDSLRGATLEEIVSRLRVIGQSLEKLKNSNLANCRFVAVSAIAPNVREIGEWLQSNADLNTNNKDLAA